MEEKMQPEEWIKTVHTIKHSELKGTSQCQMKDHQWVKLSENEVRCTKCPTAIIINPTEMSKYIDH